jgi:hypothetical protein
MGVIEQRPKTEAQKIGWRNIVGIKNRDKRLSGASEPGPQRPSFEAGAVRALDQADTVTSKTEFRDGCPGYFSARIGAVIEQLYLQPIARPVQRHDRIKDAAHEPTLVEGRNLDEDGGKLIVSWQRSGKRNPFSLEPGTPMVEVEQHGLRYAERQCQLHQEERDQGNVGRSPDDAEECRGHAKVDQTSRVSVAFGRTWVKSNREQVSVVRICPMRNSGAPTVKPVNHTLGRCRTATARGIRSITMSRQVERRCGSSVYVGKRQNRPS